MMTRGARAERQANLQLLASVRQETDDRRRQLEDKRAAMPVLSGVQAEEVAGRIFALSLADVLEFFQGYRLRMAGDNPWSYYYMPPRDNRHDGDPEMAEAVGRANLALSSYDDARLHLRIAEFFGGRIPAIDDPQRAEWDFSTFFTLDMFQIQVSAAKAISFYEALGGKDMLVVEREVFERLLIPFIDVRAGRRSEKQSDYAPDRMPRDAPVIIQQ